MSYINLAEHLQELSQCKYRNKLHELINFIVFISGCDFRQELLLLKNKLHEEFIIKERPPIYDPDEFSRVCESAGDKTIFETVLNGITDKHHQS